MCTRVTHYIWPAPRACQLVRELDASRLISSADFEYCVVVTMLRWDSTLDPGRGAERVGRLHSEQAAHSPAGRIPLL